MKREYHSCFSSAENAGKQQFNKTAKGEKNMKADRTFTSKRASKSHIRPHFALSALVLALAPTSQAIAQLML
jgi:hypothetical protein